MTTPMTQDRPPLLPPLPLHRPPPPPLPKSYLWMWRRGNSPVLGYLAKPHIHLPHSRAPGLRDMDQRGKTSPKGLSHVVAVVDAGCPPVQKSCRRALTPHYAPVGRHYGACISSIAKHNMPQNTTHTYRRKHINLPSQSQEFYSHGLQAELHRLELARHNALPTRSVCRSVSAIAMTSMHKCCCHVCTRHDKR